MIMGYQEKSAHKQTTAHTSKNSLPLSARCLLISSLTTISINQELKWPSYPTLPYPTLPYRAFSVDVAHTFNLGQLISKSAQVYMPNYAFSQSHSTTMLKSKLCGWVQNVCLFEFIQSLQFISSGKSWRFLIVWMDWDPLQFKHIDQLRLKSSRLISSTLERGNLRVKLSSFSQSWSSMFDEN